MPKCLIIDDEPDILELLVMTLKPMDIDCYTASNLAQAKEQLLAHEFDFCLTDMRLPDGNGMELVELIGTNYPNMPVAMITAYGDVESAVNALKAGAFDFVSKPVGIEQLRKLVNTALQLPKEHTVREDGTTQPRISYNEVLSSNLVGQSKAMQKVKAQIKKLARSQAPIYIKGESGTGKEVVARMIHALGARANKPFTPVNCGAIPMELMESEFFGHKKGSFSGAYNDKTGLFQAAEGGTLFLDEIAELPLSMQAKLLRAIQEKQIRSVGAAKEIPVDVRILSATHRDLAQLVKQGKFRQDLFFRINVIELYIPPLSERSEDIPLLVNNILTKLNSNDPMPDQEQPHLSESAMASLKAYSFPGNVRELENILERAITLCDNNIIESEDLQLPDSQTIVESDPSITPLINESNTTQLDPLLEYVEKETIRNALQQTKGNKTKAAELLGLTLGAFRHRLKKIGFK
jgi:two-component system, NtrC family, response regulator PilR